MPADLEYFLNTSQWLDASALGVEQSLPRLIDAVQRALVPALAASPDRAGPTRPSLRPSQGPLSKPTTRGWRFPVIALGLLITSGLGYFALVRLWPEKHRATEQPTIATARVDNAKSIAVLPFTDIREKHDQEYFADGMADSIHSVEKNR